MNKLEILSAILRKQNLSEIPKTVEGLYDATNIVLKYDDSIKMTFNTADYVVDVKKNSIEFKNKEFNSIDFGKSNLSKSIFTKCVFKNCSFLKVNFKESRFFGCEFTDCRFERTDFSYALFARDGNSLGKFDNCVFNAVSLRKSQLDFPLFSNSTFNNSDFDSVDFNGSRFSNVKFTGKVENVRFRGIGHDLSKSLLPWKNINPTDYRNPMKNVDFSGALLIATDFSHAIDLKDCIWPSQNTFLLIKEHKKIFINLQNNFETFGKEDKLAAQRIVKNQYLLPIYNDQDVLFIDKNVIEELYGKEFTNKFFTVIESEVKSHHQII